MTYVVKPKFHHPDLPKNDLGYTHRDYEGKVSTLCAGCGHDSITSAIIEACFKLSIEPHRVAKISGIGCSSKTPDYFLGNSHGFNSVHGRMPSVLTGANLANRDLIYLGVSGDGDSASIGFGQFAHSASSPPPPTAARSPSAASPIPTALSTSSASRCSSAPASWRGASPATRPSWCR
jgi:2-oxoglutarate/2-oxoacid ferredoxin oxidoreductase subunit beta